MPPGNLNRDDTGQPKKCVFGGVTRGRISSQCLKRNIRRSEQFQEAFGGVLAMRTQYLPRIVADALGTEKLGVPDDELDEIMLALTAKFSKGSRKADADEAADESDDANAGGPSSPAEDLGKTPQLVFFQQPYAVKIAHLVADLRKGDAQAYNRFLGRKSKIKISKEDAKLLDAVIAAFVTKAFDASKTLTVDIGLFGRMTTSDLVVNVEAACQVAHAISTHETLIESDYFTAMDDEKDKYSVTQTDRAGAAFMGSGETQTFFNSAVYYKYLNVDLAALRKHMPSLSNADVGQVAATLVSAAALANPTGKQNNFAAHSVPELILVEISRSKRPLSYANAFLQPIEGGPSRNTMTESAKALVHYVDSVAAAFAPADVQRVLLAVGNASINLQSSTRKAKTLVETVKAVAELAAYPERAKVSV